MNWKSNKNSKQKLEKKDPHMKERARLATRKKSPVRESHWICRLVSAGLTKLGRTTSSVCSGERSLQTPTASQGEQALRLPPRAQNPPAYRLASGQYGNLRSPSLREWSIDSKPGKRWEGWEAKPRGGYKEQPPKFAAVPQPIEDREPVIRGD